MANKDPIEALWKPGEKKPTRQSQSTPPQSTPDAVVNKKRLSGATMNMRFMKRKLETKEYEEQQRKQQKSASGQSPAHQPSPRTPASRQTPKSQNTPSSLNQSSLSPAHSSHDNIDVPMEIDPDNGSGFLKATPTDMYGVLANLLGRRSFGGFNTAVEDAWKGSKNFINDTNPDKKQTHISDEELVRRYQEIAKNRQDRPAIGNMKNKGRRRTR